MRKTVTVLGIFLAMVMVMGCATSSRVEKTEDDIATLYFRVLNLEDETANLKKKVETAEIAPIASTEVARAVPVPVEGTVLKPAEATKLTKDADEDLEQLAKRVDRHENRLNSYGNWIHDNEQKIEGHEKRLKVHSKWLSKLQRQIAEVEDETKPLYLRTQSFLSGLPKKPKEKEELPPPPAKVQAGLDRMAIEVLAGRLKLEEEVLGHADPRGKKEDNLELSKRRAQSCINYLVTKLGPNKEVPWEAGTKWEKYFTAIAGGETSRYGNYQYNRRVRFQKKK